MRDWLNARGMASQERAYLEPPDPPLVWVECVGCGGVLEHDEMLWYGDKPFCSKECMRYEKESTVDES